MTGMEENAGLLAECLEEINSALVELAAVFRVKRQVLARADMQALDELLAREQAVAEALFNAETRREVLVSEMASAAGVKSERLADLAEALPPGAADCVMESGMKLRDTIALLVRETRIVADVCRAAMDHYDKLIRIITGADLGGMTYTAGGRPGAQHHRNIIDQAI